MSEKTKTSFNYEASQSSFFNDVKKTLVQQPDYKGIGGHELKDHNNHGPHSQVSIGIGNATVNFREAK